MHNHRQNPEDWGKRKDGQTSWMEVLMGCVSYTYSYAPYVHFFRLILEQTEEKKGELLEREEDATSKLVLENRTRSFALDGHYDP